MGGLNSEMKTAEKGKVVFEEIQRELYHPPLFKRKVKAFEEKKSVLTPSPSQVEKKDIAKRTYTAVYQALARVEVLLSLYVSETFSNVIPLPMKKTQCGGLNDNIKTQPILPLFKDSMAMSNIPKKYQFFYCFPKS